MMVDPWMLAESCAVAVAAACIVGVLVLRHRQRREAARQGAASQPASDYGLRIEVGKLHEQGARDYQQDTFGVSDEAMEATHGILAVVADGMGGLKDGPLNGGDVSRLIVETVLDDFALASPKIANPKELLLTLAGSAARAVNDALGPSGLKTAGSTLLMALVRDGELSYLNVGDTRLYLSRAGSLQLLSRDLVYEGVLALRAVNGELTPCEAFQDAQAKRPATYVGMGLLDALDCATEPLRLMPGDKVLLATDGVYNALDIGEMDEALAGRNAEQAMDELASLIGAKSFAEQDNYTAVCLSCEREEER